ncbi:MAG: nqrF 2 [Firmicutes bacterium]|nr:nqrF 2 [Bacillota bacterium]
MKIAETFVAHIAGTNTRIACSGNKTLLQSLIDAGLVVEAACAGLGTCGKCRIKVQQGQVTGQNGLPATPLFGNTYLACQVYPAGDVSLKLAAVKASAKGRLKKQFAADGRPLVRKEVVDLTYPTLETPYSLQEMLCQNSASADRLFDHLNLVRQLPGVLADKPSQMTIVFVNDVPVALEVGNTANSLYGVAFDIGTTTVAGMLVDLRSHTVLGAWAEKNPQAVYGADVISRIRAAEQSDGLQNLNRSMQVCLNNIVQELCGHYDVAPETIYAVTVAGNSTMQHLLLGISPSSLVRKPYAAVFKALQPLTAGEINLAIHSAGVIVILPNIVSFIGSDTTAAILAVQNKATGPSLLIDLGTNGEMAIFDSRNVYSCCSTACGPAFEGAHIRDGMRAVTGAIEAVVIADDVSVTTIGDSKATGICGSGIIKAMSSLLKVGILTSAGRFQKPGAIPLPANLERRLKKRDKQWEFVLVDGDDSATGLDISITQNDVRQIQLVKSSICSGVEILLDKAGLHGDVPIYLAGAFGNYIDIESALSIGLLPSMKKELVQSVGNAAGSGAIQALLSQNSLNRCYQIADEAEYIELAGDPNFQKRFMANLTFPEVKV